MNAIVEGPTGDGAHHDIPIEDSTDWSTNNSSPDMNSNNSTLLYIEVEYVKNYKMEDSSSQQVTFNDFDPHVSPLDPNMSSVARYSPVYNEPSSTTEFNPVVIQQLVSRDGNGAQNEQFVDSLNENAQLENIPTVLTTNIQEVNGQFLQMIDENSTSIVQCSKVEDEFQIVPKNEQGVELLITDQATGISYSVSTQELLVERCLEDEERFLEALAPDPLLDSDLLTLDENTLKTQLNDDIIDSTLADTSSVVDSNNFITNDLSKNLDLNQFKMETRRRRLGALEDNVEENLLSCVYSITDKPILSRARASLPESYLVISKIDGENAVFAKKPIPMRTQFGPLEGAIIEADFDNQTDGLNLFMENNNVIYKLDISDENSSNWMGFVRKAKTYDEQNLVLSQENDGLYFTTTKHILPKQELKLGYSASYAQTFNLEVLQPKIEKSWPCYECSETFETSGELQEHLNIHDIKDENIKPRKKLLKNKRKLMKKQDSEVLECNLCGGIFPQYTYIYLKKHLNDTHHLDGNCSVEENFSIVMNLKCEFCDISFKSEPLLKIHNLEHDPDSSDEQINHVCPSCQRKFPTQRQLVMHVAQHALPKKVLHQECVKCPVCYKMFALRERLQKHMLVHGSEESKPLQCGTCNKRFLNNSALACHVKTHFVGKKVFECPICTESFDHVLKLKLHVPKHCLNNQFTCPHCNKIFKKYSIIRKHIRAFHCERKHSCQHCAKMFPTLDKLRMHLLRHSDHREFLCADCGKQFKRKDKLTEHCKRMHVEERENTVPEKSMKVSSTGSQNKKMSPKVEPTDFHRFIYKCHACLVGFKRRGMLVNHLAKRHPDIRPDSVPELNLPILQTTRDYYCQYCDKVYKSSSKRKAHILKNHPGAALPMSNRKQSSLQEVSGLPNPTFSQTVGSITTRPQNCKWCFKQYASKAKLLQHQRKKHADQLALVGNQQEMGVNNDGLSGLTEVEEVTVEDVYRNKTDEINVINSTIQNYNVDDSQYCHLTINENDRAFLEATELDNPNSHLYRLLTTSNGLLPPR